MARFKEYLNEGEIWDAICHGVKTGFRAYQDKRKEQTKKEPNLVNRMMNAEGKELESLIKKAVEDGFAARNGKLEKQPPTKTRGHQWLMERTTTKTASL